MYFVHYLSILYVCILFKYFVCLHLFKYFAKHFAEITCVPDSVTLQIGFRKGGESFIVKGVN